MVRFEQRVDEPQQDIILPVCYRNSHWALTIAHALGFGIYRRTADEKTPQFVQMFDEPELWTDIGYTRTEGELNFGKSVRLNRSEAATPGYFRELMTPEDAIQFESFETDMEQYDWIAKQIFKNINEDELRLDDIMIMTCDVYTIRSVGGKIQRALSKLKLDSHIAGITSSRDSFFVPNSIAITHIYRAKGNEAPMVYVVGAENCFKGLELLRKRNILFTAITRSRTWVRVCGVGSYMKGLLEEVQSVYDNNYSLRFGYPTPDQIEKIRKINRDMTAGERKSLEDKITAAAQLIDDVKSGKMPIDALPPDLRKVVQGMIEE